MRVARCDTMDQLALIETADGLLAVGVLPESELLGVRACVLTNLSPN